MKHTPGPWEFTSYTKEDGSPILTTHDVAVAVASSALKSDLAELWGVSMPGADGPVICYTGNGPASLANARFIAAAPDLLEALKSLLGIDWEGVDHSNIPEWILAKLGAALAAIAKADGKVEAGCP